MAYNPSRFGTPSSSKLWQQGLLQRKQGSRGLFGPNLQQGGVPLGGRMNLIGGGGPNPYLTKETGNFTKRLSPPTSTAVKPRTFKTGGLKVADILKGAQFGQFAPEVGQPQAPQAGFGQFGPQAAEAQAVQGVQGAQGSTDVLQSVTDIGNAYAQRPGEEGPESVLAPAQNFLSRMRDGVIGEKGSGKRSDIGRSMMQAGAQMMKGNPQGTFATIGQGLEAGLGGYQELKEDRRVQSDWEEDERRREEINAGIDASIDEVRDADGNITRRRLTDEEAAQVRAAGGAEGVVLAASFRQGTKKRAAIDLFSIGADDAYLELLRAQDDDTALALVTEYAKGKPAEAARVAHLVQMGYSQEVAELAGADSAATQAVLNRGMETTIMRDGSGVLRIFHDGEFVGSAGKGAPEITAAEAKNLELAKQGVLWNQSDGARQKVRDEHTRLTASVEALPNLVETVEAINEAPPEYFDATGKLKLGVDHWLGLDDKDLGQKVDQMLTAFGILNLDAFTGAISDRELVVALANAGEIGKSVAMINAVLARSINQTIDAATRQNVSAKDMDKMLATTEVAQAAVATGQDGLWTNQFGFDMGSEGELGEDGLYTGGTGLLGYKMRADQAMTDMLDAAREEAGGLIMVDPETGEAAQPLTPAQTISGFGGGQPIVRGIAGIPGLLANPGSTAALRLSGDDPSRPGLATRSDYERENN